MTRNDQAKLKVLLASRDANFTQEARAAFANDVRIDLLTVETGIDLAEEKIRPDHLAAIVVDFDPTRTEDKAAFERLARRLDAHTPIIAIPSSFDQSVARWLLKIRVGDFLIRPVATADLVRTVTRAISGAGEDVPGDAQIYSFMPAAGGVGVTTLAVATAFVLAGESKRVPSSTCIVDLNFQYGACADYLDVEPRLNLDEIENRPERLDRQLLEVMISHHPSGVSVIAAPNAPAEMRSFDSQLVTRLLDLVAAYFNTVVIDMPRTWFQWTENVLMGSDKIFVVSEMTVPGLRQTQRLISAIKDRVNETLSPQVIVNRFEQRTFDNGLTRADIDRALGGAFAGIVPNNYRLVREAIDRGVPLDEVRKGNEVTVALRKIVSAPRSESSFSSIPLFGLLGRKLVSRGSA